MEPPPPRTENSRTLLSYADDCLFDEVAPGISNKQKKKEQRLAKMREQQLAASQESSVDNQGPAT